MIFPKYDGDCGWYEILSEPEKVTPITSDLTVHTAIIGGGFVGMSAAHRLAELLPDEEFVLLDALQIGQGASGRNSGFVIDQPHKRDLELSSHENKRHLLHLNRLAIHFLEQKIADFQIDCQWSRAGKYQGAVGSRGEAFLNHYETLLKDFGEPYSRLTKQERENTFGTSYYSEAIYTPGGALVQPAALMRGLAKNLPENVRLAEHTPVSQINKEISGYVLTTPNGLVRCNKIILANNIFAREFGFLKDRILPIMTFASMTAPLTDSQMRTYGGQLDWGITPADHGGTTLRMTQDKRIIIRNSYRHAHDYNTPKDILPLIKQRHRKSFDVRYPHLKNVRFSYTWGGASALSSNFETFFGELQDGIFSANCDQSVGAARGTVSGMMLAEKVAGTNSPDLATIERLSGNPAKLPPKALLRVGVPARLEYERFISRSEF